ncbi:MAG: hypothetical protein H0X45_02245 [Planctomycetes bacterium]|nr:hypothetical protein [Planctomycetota bacterium]
MTHPLAVAIALFLLFVVLVPSHASEVLVARAPGGGIQPQAAVDADGTVHLVTFTGDPAAGDLDYRTRATGAAEFSAAIPVNSVRGSGIATGTVRGAHLAIGRDGWVHVAWMGAQGATPKGPQDSTPMLYARLRSGDAGFEPQRNVMTWAKGLDGGGTIAADERGRVAVAWHADPLTAGEAGRAVFVALSQDDGASFAKEIQPVTAKTGACGCCGMRAAIAADGSLYLGYRGADGGARRDFLLAALGLKGTEARVAELGSWKIPSCPMSTCAIVRTTDGMLVAWEQETGLHWTRIVKGKPAKPVLVATNAKHPSLAEAADGSVLVAWAEGAGWNKGGQLRWRIYDRQAQPRAESQQSEELPSWSMPTAVATGPAFSIWY